MISVYKCDAGKLAVVPDGISAINRESDIFWIDLLNPTAEEDRAVETFLGISVPTREDMKEIESSSRLYNEDGAEFMTVEVVARLHLDDPQKTQVTFINMTGGLVTVRYADLMAFTHVMQGLEKKAGIPCSSAAGIMYEIIESMIDRIADTLEDLGDGIDELSSDIFRAKKISVKRKTGMLQSAIRRIGLKGDLLSMLRESLATISRLMSHHTPALDDKAARSRMVMLSRDVSSLNDHSSFLSTKMNFLLDATLGMINLEQNQIIKIFSIAAVVFLPPTLIASIYGMNFRHMPELEWVYSYPVVLALMVLAGLLPIAYFKKKGWL